MHISFVYVRPATLEYDFEEAILHSYTENRLIKVVVNSVIVV